MPEEQKRKISESNIGREVSEKTRRKISESQIGKVVPQETRDKISKTLAGKPNTLKRKLNDDQIIAILNDLRKGSEIAKDYNIHRMTVSRVKTGKIKPLNEIK